MNIKPRSELRLVLWLACSIGLGVAAGLPIISNKNGLGLLVVLAVSVFAIATISTLGKREFAAGIDEPHDPKPRTRLGTFLSVAGFAITGSSLAVCGGLLTHYVSPMHPLDVLWNLTALGSLGAFAGFVVGVTLQVAVILSNRA
ncbi:MAG: hypothetical protein U0930_13375 [Pirellulales bacterium]